MNPDAAKLVFEPARRIPIAHACDVCVIGGSCTGVFAAVRAARLGLSVCIVEQNVIFGGVATAAQVNEWHSTLDAHHENPIIAGLTIELIDRLRRRDAVKELPKGGRGQFRFNSAEMAGELDALVIEHRIRPFLRATCVAALREGNRITEAIIEDKSGRRAIRANVFIDASGDGDLLRHAGFAAYQASELQPVNLQALVAGFGQLNNKHPGVNFWHSVRERAEEFGYPQNTSTPWPFDYPGVPEVVNVFGPRVSGVDGSDADQVTQALINGRKYIRALSDMSHAQLGVRLPIVSWAQALSVRQTWQCHGLHTLTGDEILSGYSFLDAIANGTYPVDIHHPDGTVLRYLDGREEIVARDGSHNWGRWRSQDQPTPRCYHIPYRSLVPRDAENLLVAGRLLDADRQAFGGVRVMVNTNQMGEAAGVAAFLAHKSKQSVAAIDTHELRRTLAQGGSIVI
jgi:2-polyprenyl-6-methoxyphenol hydroxylase-like FAD-dependent oxidoreductase